MSLKFLKGIVAGAVIFSFACAGVFAAEKKAGAPLRGTDSAAVTGGPQILKDGVKFTLIAPQAKKVFIAGEFNNWGDNQNGVVAKDEYLLEKDKKGVWSKTVKLAPGKYQYKFVIDGDWKLDPTNPDKFKEPNGNENSLVKVMPKGVDLGPKVTKGGIKFTYYAPNAEKVFLAGEFNNWGDNQSGVVSNDTYLMSKGKDGVWSKTVKLESGTYKYKFVIDSGWVADPFGTSAGDADGNSSVTVK